MDKRQLYKAYIGKGNNAGLVKEIIKKRWWWVITDDKTDCKFVWSQLKDKHFYQQYTEAIHNHFIHNEELGCKK